MSGQPDIQAMFLEYNKQYFDGIIPDIPIEWNTRLRTTAGYCRWTWTRDPITRRKTYQVKSIELNPRLFAKNGWDAEELRRTLIHEMVHAWEVTKYNGPYDEGRVHGEVFQSKMDQIFGYKRSHRCHDYDTKGLKEERKIEARCPIHGVVYRYARMPRRRKVCRKCGSSIEMIDMRNRGGIKIKINL